MTGLGRGAAVASLLGLAACAAPPPLPVAVTQVPPSRILALPPAPADPGEAARVTIRREQGYSGSGQGLLLKIDGVEVAHFLNHETLTLDLRAGWHQVVVAAHPGGADSRAYPVALQAGGHLHFRGQVTIGGAVLEPFTP